MEKRTYGSYLARSTKTGNTKVETESINRGGSEMRGVLELQAMLLSDLAGRENQMKGLSGTRPSSRAQDLNRLKVDTVEALQKLWNKRQVGGEA